ncbi:hypothetical protein Vau01_036230 [Virgisporangium aurantiacum]|uniref:Uncharacterized protein n=1 Tax=Virgisporangium aurantiacum TaxID=175570 RepID=A0A8J3Z490_9ACTN|nr:hypothetical protein Vau01_036230 [Virgisporangium aurantiacum]
MQGCCDECEPTAVGDQAYCDPVMSAQPGNPIYRSRWPSVTGDADRWMTPRFECHAKQARAAIGWVQQRKVRLNRRRVFRNVNA